MQCFAILNRPKWRSHIVLRFPTVSEIYQDIHKISCRFEFLVASGGSLFSHFSWSPADAAQFLSIVFLIFVVEWDLFYFWLREQLLVCGYPFCRLGVDCVQNILWECYRSFRDTCKEYLKLKIFLNFEYSTHGSVSVRWLVRLYLFDSHEAILRSHYSHRGFRFCWDS